MCVCVECSVLFECRVHVCPLQPFFTTPSALVQRMVFQWSCARIYQIVVVHGFAVAWFGAGVIACLPALFVRAAVAQAFCVRCFGGACALQAVPVSSRQSKYSTFSACALQVAPVSSRHYRYSTFSAGELQAFCIPQYFFLAPSPRKVFLASSPQPWFGAGGSCWALVVAKLWRRFALAPAAS